MVELPFPPNDVRWPRDRDGHYESFYVKANAPDRRLGLWIKHNLMAPAGSDAPPFGESWAVLMDGDAGEHLVAKRVVPADEVELSPPGGIVRLGPALLTDSRAEGEIPDERGRLSAAWAVDLAGDEPPLLHLPAAWMYTAAFPRKKMLTPRPFLELSGTFRVGDREVDLGGWTGLQGHNWGRAHAVDYAYANANRFHQRHDARFDGFSARIALGSVTTPRLTACVLRLGDTEFAFNKARRWLGSGRYPFPRWSFQLHGDRGHRLSGALEATPAEFVGLAYADPTGTMADCLNTKFARGELVLERRVRRRWDEVQRLTSDAFELEFLYRDLDHGIDVVGGNPFDEIAS